MTQLIIDGQIFPETDPEQYQCYDEELGEFPVMISGRMVFEVRGTVKMISYAYRYFDDDLRLWCVQNLRKGRRLTVNYLDTDSVSGSTELKTSTFLCTEPPRPYFYASKEDNVYWTSFSFTLREERPHD